MQEVIALLDKELEFVRDIKAKAEEQKTALTNQRGGATAGKIAEEIMMKLTALSQTGEEQTALLKNRQCETLNELIEKQPVSEQRTMAAEKLQILQMELRELERITTVSKKLLAKDMEFAGFTINVMNQVAADVTYAPQGESGPAPLRGKKMFDQSV